MKTKLEAIAIAEREATAHGGVWVVWEHEALDAYRVQPAIDADLAKPWWAVAIIGNVNGTGEKLRLPDDVTSDDVLIYLHAIAPDDPPFGRDR